MTTAITLGSINYRDSGRHWRAISSQLVPADDPDYSWRNEANDYSVMFKRQLVEDFMRFRLDGRSFRLSLVGALSSSAVVSGRRISYPSVFPSVDLEYRALPDAVKETLVLADASAPSAYSFTLDPPGGQSVEAERDADGSWLFTREPEHEPLLRLAAPWAIDAAGVGWRENNVSLSVTRDGSVFDIDVRVDPAWLSSPDRVFPVYVDPTFDDPRPADQSTTVTADCPTCSADPYEPLGIGTVDGFPGDQAILRSAFRFSMPNIPTDSQVLSAELDLAFGEANTPCLAWTGGNAQNPNGDCLRAHTLNVHKLTASWNESSPTQQFSWDATVLASFDLPYPTPPPMWMTWSTTPLKDVVQGWVANPSQNFGLLVKRSSEASYGLGGPRVPGRSWPDPDVRPVLWIDHNSRPNPPTLESPNNNAFLDTTTPVLRATATDVDPDELDYWFQVDDDAQFGSPLVAESPWQQNTFTAPPGTVKDGHTYYWRVKAGDGGGESDWSPTGTFNIRLKKLGIRDYWPMWSRGSLAVNEANGNLVLSLPGPSYPYGTNAMSAAVSYNSQSAATDQGLGPRWVLDIGGDASPPTNLVDHSRLPPNDPNYFDAVERVSGDGSSDYYTHVGGSNTYLSTPGDDAQLTKNADATWTLLDSDGAIYTFGAADGTTGIAALTSSEWIDEEAFQTPLTYCSTNGKVTSIRNAGCGGSPTRELNLAWTCAGALLCVTGPDGVTWKYIGDTNGGTSGKLARINDGTRDVVAITYDATGTYPIKIQNANDLDPTHASPGYNALHALTIAYDASNRVQSVSDGPTTNQTPATSTWTFDYTPSCTVVATRAAHAGIPQGTVRTAEGCTALRPPRQQPNGNTMKTIYDNLGHPIQITDLLGNITMAGYDERDQLLWSEDEDGNPTDVTYADVEGNTTTNPWVATAPTIVTGPDPDGTSGPLARPVSRTRYDETRMGDDLATTSGSLITDAVRAAGVEGDGRAAPDASFGIWEGTTNLLLNGGAETNTNSWSATSATLSRSTLRWKFGTASLRAIVQSGNTSYSASTTAPLKAPTAGRTFTGSLWLYAEDAAVGKTLATILREEGGATGTQETSVNQTLVAGWQRLTVTRTLTQNDRTTFRLLVSRPSGATNGEHIYLDGVQLEEKPMATPYVETNGGTKTRAVGRAQLPSTLLTTSTGWVAARIRAGRASTGANLRLFTWGATSTNELYLRYGSGAFRMGRTTNGSTFEAQQAATFATGDTITVVGQWYSDATGDGLKVSVNGGAFAQLSNASSQPIGTTFDLGQRGYAPQDFLDGDILWAATGTGPLTNADAAALNAFGNETPGTWSYPPSANATGVWTADTASYQQPIPSTGPRVQGLQAAYYANANLAGRPTKLKNDSQVSFNWGTGGPPELPGVTDNFSIRWTGYVKITSPGNYVFGTLADDGVRLTVDGLLAIDNWAQAPGSRCSQPINLSLGLHKISLDYFEAAGSAQAELRWTNGICGTEQPIPSASLVPAWFNQTSSVSPAGRTSFSHFPDPANARSDYSLVRLLDGTNLITSLTYDAYGRVTQKVMPKGNATRTIDANGNLQGSGDTTFATTYTYYSPGEVAFPPGACGQGPGLDQAQLLKSTAPRGIATSTFVYNLAGDELAETNAVGTTCSSYDAEGRLTQTKAPGDSQWTTYTYDPDGAQRTASDTSGTVTSEYDEQGRVKRSVDSFAAEAKFAYDEEGNVRCRIASNGALLPGNADCTAGSNYTTNYVYDYENNLTSQTDPAGRQYSFYYDTRSNLKATRYPNGTFSWNDYNAAGWLTATYNRHYFSWPNPLPSSVPPDSQGSPLADFSYSYEQDGRKTQQIRTGGNSLPTETENYRFDALGRMDVANLADGTNRRYFFDRDSNRTQLTDNGTTTATYSYDPSNPNSPGVDQLTSATESGQPRTFAYRPDGEMTARGADTLSWDGWGRLTGGTFSGTTVTYSFDPRGFRRQRAASGTTTRYLHSGLYETDGTGAITLTDVDGGNGDLAHFAGAPTPTTTVTYLYYNGHGDLAAEATDQGVRTNAYTYDPFGAPKQAPTGNKAIERWTGRWDKKLDTTSSLIEMGDRPYDPKLGRFLAVDPVEGGSLNNYDYAGQDPINVYDLDGGAMTCAASAEGCGLNVYAVWVTTTGATISSRHGVRRADKGGSGKPRSHTVRHKSKKAAKDAAAQDSAKGRAPVKHTKHGPRDHYHSVNSRGRTRSNPRVHHDYGKTRPS